MKRIPKELIVIKSVASRAALPMVAVLCLVAAGCGGTKSPSVASLTNSSTTSSSTTAAPPSGSSSNQSSSSSGGSGIHMVMKAANAAKFAACMRKNGVPNFPDPDSSGGISFGPGSGIDPNSPKFKSASQKCQSLLPNGGQPTPAQQAQAQKQMLAFSACMRSHGIKDFPDPNFSGGHASLQLKGNANSDLNPNSPTFQNAQKACQGFMPLGKVTSK